jgi:hypothetical protein
MRRVHGRRSGRELRRHAIERLEHADEAAVVADVHAEAGRVLADEVQLERAVGEQLPRLGDDRLERLRAHLAADRRNGAEGAALVAPFGDPQVRPVPRREAETTRVVLEVADALAVLAVHGEADDVLPALARGLERVRGDPVARPLRRVGQALARHRAHGVEHVVAVEDADHRVDAGRPFEELRAVTLHEAACNDDSLDLAALLALDRLADHVERLVLRRLEEPAGVDDDRIGRLVAVDERIAAVGEHAEHLLAVDEILRASERHERHLRVGGRRRFRLLGRTHRMPPCICSIACENWLYMGIRRQMPAMPAMIASAFTITPTRPR